jgi:hypothetical protein
VDRTRPAFRSGWPVRRGVVAVGSGRCPPACAGNVGRFWSVAVGRRAFAGVASQAPECAYSARYPPACVHSISRPTRPCTTTCGISAILVRLVRSYLGAITSVGASPPQAGDGQLVGWLHPNVKHIINFEIYCVYRLLTKN